MEHKQKPKWEIEVKQSLMKRQRGEATVTRQPGRDAHEEKSQQSGIHRDQSNEQTQARGGRTHTGENMKGGTDNQTQVVKSRANKQK